MKLLQSFLPLFLLSLVTLGACHKSDDSSPSNNNVIPATGTWKVSYFFDKQDQTGNLSNYTFEFGTNGVLVATNGGQIWTGTWSTGVDDSGNKFVINFSGSTPSALSELSEDWHIVIIQDNFMHFEHTSGGNGDTRVLKFNKI